MDRGGLKHITDKAHYYVIQVELRRHLVPTIASDDTDTRPVCLEKIISNEEVLFYWSLVSYNWEDEISDILLKLVAEHWIKLRGFSFASAFIRSISKTIKR